MELEDFYDGLYARHGFCKVTVEGYKRTLSKILRDLGAEKPTARQIEKYIAEMHKKGYSYSHLRNTIIVLERYSKFLKRPIKLARPRKPQSIIKEVLTEAEIVRILAATKNIREKAILSILAYTGIRNKELCLLRVEDIDFENSIIKVVGGKFNKDRIVNIQRDGLRTVGDYLGEYKRDSKDWLFTTLTRRSQYTGWTLRKLVKVVSGRARIRKRVYPHLFRHSIASLLVQKGANLMTIMSLLGHKNYATTLIYAQFSPQRVAQEYNFYCPVFT
jgi:integrase/recombinase XerD